MQRREFGSTGIQLSALTFGSMRLTADRMSIDNAVDLLTALVDAGVTTFHSSSEYDSHAFFCRALAELRQRRRWITLEHICKIAAPDFDDLDVSPGTLTRKIDSELERLGAERVDVVQWLVRSSPIDESTRLRLLDQLGEPLGAELVGLVRSGKVGAVASFPYSVGFAEAALALAPCEGLVTYLNLVETEMAALLPGLTARGQGCIAIRPLFAGALAGDGDAVRSALQFPLLHPNVASVILSVSSREHARAAAEAVDNVVPDISAFDRVCPRPEALGVTAGPQPSHDLSGS